MWLLGTPLLLQAQSDEDVLDGTYWKEQGLADILPAWTDRGQDRTHGGFYAELERDWTPSDTSTQYPGMLSRHLYSYAAAYLMSGNEDHLEQAEAVFDFMIDHGWDEQFGGWYNAVHPSGEVADDSKDLFMQIYATTGLALYTLVTQDPTAKTYLEHSRRFMHKNAWDEQHGGYVDVLNRDGSVQAPHKDFSPQLAPLSGYLLYLYPATRDSTYLHEAERIMDLTLTHMQDDRGWILERFERDWTFQPDDSKNSHINVGHNLEVAWLLLRLYALTGTEAYLDQGLDLTDQLLDHAFLPDTGAWLHDLNRTNPSEHPETTVWWVQAYGNMLQLYAYRMTGDERYLNAFREGARFWNEAFVDDRHGGTVLRTDLDGAVVDGDKAVRTKTSYHALEHSLLNYLYLSLWHNDEPITLHYHVDEPDGEWLYPLPIEDTPHIERVTINGSPQTPPDTANGALRLPAQGPASITIEMTSSSSPQ